MARNPGPSMVFSMRSLILLFVSAVIGVVVWTLLSYARISAVSFKFDRPAAEQIARQYLQKEMQVDPALYMSATVFVVETDPDRYLQRTLGMDEAIALRAKYDYDMFRWSARFFRPGQKEEYRVVISPRTGRVIGARHTIPETASRPEMSGEQAKEAARKFLVDKVGVRLSDYVLLDESHTVKDHRVDHGFTWKHKNVDIPWTKDPDGGSAKLLTGASVSGGEILNFVKDDMYVPDRFNRYLDQEQEVGRNLSLIFGLLYIGLIVMAVVQLINSRQHLAVRSVRPFLSKGAVFLAVAAVLAAFNVHETTVVNYVTSQDFTAFLFRFYAQNLVSILFFLIGFILIALAGESLCAKNASSMSSDVRGSLLWHVRSSFMTRSVFVLIVAGYCIACILLGFQAFIFRIGEQYFGVWAEEYWVTQFSTAYWPFWTALVIGLQASLWEEMLFRVFLFQWLKQHLRSVILAALLASLFWGFGHSNYQVFPMWFRGVEVTILGLILSWAYLRYGLVTVLVAHYLFDVFWGSAGLLLSSSAPIYFWSAVAALALPAAWAAAAWYLNRSEELRPLELSLSPAQSFHFNILSAYVAIFSRDGGDLQKLRQDCLNHGWDPAVVDKALGKYLGDK